MKKIYVISILLTVWVTVRAEYNRDWWKELTLEPTATNDLSYATSELVRQEDSVTLLFGVDYCTEDSTLATNLWNMLAVLHGDLRSKQMDVIPVG